MPEIEAVIFDMDGVLCHLDDEVRIDHLAAKTGCDKEFVVHAIWGSGFEDRADAGEFNSEEYLAKFGTQLRTQFSREAWIAYRKSGMTPIPDVLLLAANLSRSLPCALLTNNGHLLVEEIDSLFPELRPIFGDRIWCSAQFARRKPDPRIFMEACEKLGSTPSQTLFIDDREENVSGALEAGLRAHRFVDCLGLESFINGYGNENSHS